VVDFDDGALLRSDGSSAISFIDRIGPHGMSCLLRMSIALELGLGLGPFLDLAEDLHQMRQPALVGVARIGQPFPRGR
jgi:hypothetical protein